MAISDINKIILDKIEDREMDDTVKKFIKEVLSFEKGKIDEQRPRYTNYFENLLNKYSNPKK